MSRFFRLLRYDWPLHFVLLFTNWLPDNVALMRLRGWLAHFFLGSCGKDLRLGRDIVFYNPSQIKIGKHVYIAYGNWFSASALITISDEVIIGPKNVFASGNHTKENNSFRYGIPHNKDIMIGKGSWVGANCTITAGVIIGNGSLIGANTVVTKEVPNSVMFAGNPGRVIKEI